MAGGIFSVQDFGTTGNGTTDDTAAFQAALDAALAVRGKLLIPPPAVAYRLESGLVIGPPGGKGQCRLQVEGWGNYDAIHYHGPSGSSVFRVSGLKDSHIEGVRVWLPNSAQNVTVWDMHSTDAAPSANQVSWEQCRASFGSGGNNVGWRCVQSASGWGDWACIHWKDCGVTGLGRQYGDVAFQNISWNALPWMFSNCAASLVNIGYLSGPVATTTSPGSMIGSADTTLPVTSTLGFTPQGTLQINSEQITYTGLTSTAFTGCTRGANGTTPAVYNWGGYVASQVIPGAGPVGMAASLTWLGGGGSGNGTDFHLQCGGSYVISGGRWETGQRFLRCGAGAAGFSESITVTGTTVASYAPPDGILCELKCATQLALQGCTLTGPFDAHMITEAAATPSYGSLRVTDSVIQASDPFYTLTHSNWPVEVKRVAVLSAQNRLVGYFQGV